jgi:predicted transposase/invertase (TIGR01784 family)
VTIKIHNPHDAIFKKFFSDIEVANSFIKAYLKKELKQKCDFSTLKIEPGSFIDEDLRQQYSDILYSLKIDGVKGYVYINVEHQSTPNELMPFRMLRYKLAVMKQHLDQGHKKLPAVIPMLFYHGRKRPYPYSLELIDCFEDKEFAKNHFFNPPLLVDISQVSDDQFISHKTLGPLEIVQKYIFTTDLESIAGSLAQLMEDSQTHPAHELFNGLVYYMLKQGKAANVEKVIEILLTIEDYREDVMNAAQQLEQKGLQKGLEQGLKKGLEEGEHRKAIAIAAIAKQLLAEGRSPGAVQKLTGLPEKEVMDLVEAH